LERLGAIVLGHPPYSPDLAPSDFFLFGHIKRLLGGYHFENAGELLSMVVKIIDAITKEMRENVFFEWRRRLDVVSKSDGDYII
jgi:hypothetical protein